MWWGRFVYCFCLCCVCSLYRPFHFWSGLLVFFLWDIICAYSIFYTLLVPGSTLLTVIREIRVQMLAGDIFFSQHFFFVERKFYFIFP